MRKRVIFLSLLAVTFIFCLGARARAEEVGVDTAEPVILQMADGRFYNPTTGKIGGTREELLREMGLLIAASTGGLQPPPAPPLQGGESVSFPLRDAILQGKKLLNEEKSDGVHTIKSVPHWQSVKLAVWNQVTNEVTLMAAEKKGTNLRLPGGSALTFDPSDPLILVGMRYHIYNEVVVSKKKKNYKVEERVVTPFNPALNTPQMVAWGKQILHQELQEVYQKLDQKNIHSVAFPDKLITQTIDTNVAKAIAVIEHTSNKALERDPKGTINTFFAGIGINEDAPYGNARSTANALGLVQFIPSTYNRLVKQRPELELNKNFEAGMNDIHNSLLAQVVYLDDILSDLPLDARIQYQDQLARGRVSEFMVAAYNGGPARVKNAIVSWDELWDKERQAKIQQLNAQHQKWAASIATLNKQIKKATTAAKKKKLKADLAAAQSKDKKVLNELTPLQKTNLKKETLDYILKYRTVINILNETPVLVARKIGNE